MGWWSDYKPKGMKMLDFFKKKYNFENDNIKMTVLDGALVNMTEGYIAIERITKEDNKREVFALVALFDWCNGLNYNCMIKEMDETVYPYYFNCPERILKLLTPTDDENAIKWREKCYHIINKKKMLKKGIKIKLSHAIEFSGGWKDDTFQLVDMRRNLCRAVNAGIMVRLSKNRIALDNFTIL